MQPKDTLQSPVGPIRLSRSPKSVLILTICLAFYSNLFPKVFKLHFHYISFLTFTHFSILGFITQAMEVPAESQLQEDLCIILLQE